MKKQYYPSNRMTMIIGLLAGFLTKKNPNQVLFIPPRRCTEKKIYGWKCS
jgi:hypothetical protein